MMPLEEWIAAETTVAGTAMLGAISATHLLMERPGFAQRVVPRPGSVLASPVPAHYDPDPDYFFHWFRDSAIVIDALRVAFAQGSLGSVAVTRLGEFVQFSLGLRSLDGRVFLRAANLYARVQSAYRKFVRPEAELAALAGPEVALDARVNADGTPDFLRWGRPQLDGPALRCLALLRWWRELRAPPAALHAALAELIASDLELTLASVDRACFDIWEEHSGYHYYTQLLQAEALQSGAVWLDASGQPQRADACEAAAQRIAPRLEAMWSETEGFYRSSLPATPVDGTGRLDSAVILGVLHAGRARGMHSLLDPRVQATLAVLEELFGAEYAINRDRTPERGPAMGRYAHDRYYSGGAYYFATLAAAEFYFRLSAALRSGEELPAEPHNRRFRERLRGASAPVDAERLGLAALAFERGDTFLRTVQAFTPASGELSEQFDRTTGAQTSARHLAWSYAAFITAAASRTQACRASPGSGSVAPAAGTA